MCPAKSVAPPLCSLVFAAAAILTAARKERDRKKKREQLDGFPVESNSVCERQGERERDSNSGCHPARVGEVFASAGQPQSKCAP